MTSERYRSKSERMLGGVCGGLSDYLGVDVTLIRVFFIVSAMASGLGIIFYLALWLTTPPQGQEALTRQESIRLGADEVKAQAGTLTQELQAALDKDDPQARMIVRWALAILIGLVAGRVRANRKRSRPQIQVCRPERPAQEATAEATEDQGEGQPVPDAEA